MKKTWTGRFKKQLDKDADVFNASISFDKKLFKYDVKACEVHARALLKAQVISSVECAKILSGLSMILKKEKSINFDEYEDVHSAVEMELVKSIGEVGKKIHTGRSRNDLVATDTRMYLRDEINDIRKIHVKLLKSLLAKAKKSTSVYMPGYTHMQQAQIVSAGQWMMAYFTMLKRDLDILEFIAIRNNDMPLGSGALAGSNYSLDRNFMAKGLGFNKPLPNSMDAVSNRDFLVDFTYFASMTAVHLSRFAEEMIIYNSSEFSFIEIDDAFATGSSIMPQKKNPDIPELIRGKTGNFFGALISSLTMMKGLPLSYNKDMQEDKQILFKAVDEIKAVLFITEKFIKNIKFNPGAMKKQLENSFLYAVDIADYLVKKGVSFRNAHEATGKLVSYCIENRKQFTELSFKEFVSVSADFDEGVTKIFEPEKSASAKKTAGSTAEKEVMKQIAAAEKLLK